MTLQLEASLTSLPEVGQTGAESPPQEGDDTQCSSCVSLSVEEPNSAISYCKQCTKRFCESHLKLHEQLFSKHETVPVGDLEEALSQVMVCSEHRKYLCIVGCSRCERLYCNLCLVVMPNYCFKAVGAHNSHQFAVIEKVISNSKLCLQGSVMKLTLKQARLEKVVSDAEKVVEVLGAHRERCTADVETALRSQLASIETIYNDIISNIRERCAAVEENLTEFLTDVNDKQKRIDVILSELQECLADGSNLDLLTQRDRFGAEVEELCGPENIQLANHSVPTLVDNDGSSGTESNVRTEVTSLSELVQGLSLIALQFHNEPTAPTAHDLSTMLPPPLPAALHLSHTLMLYKSDRAPPPEVYCAYEDVIYCLSNKWLNRHKGGLQSAARICSHADEGVTLQAHAGKLYTRQMNGPNLLNVYPLLGEVVLPRERAHPFQWQQPLLPSFAFVGDSIVFCESAEYPKLIIFPMAADSPPREVAILFERHCMQVLYMVAGPPGHVAVIAKEWVELHDVRTVLRLIRLDNGSTVWQLPLASFSPNFQHIPNPVVYHNGYMYWFAKIDRIKVLDITSGEQLKELTLPSLVQEGTPLSIEYMQLCVYNDTQILLPAAHRVQAVKQRYHSVRLALCNIESENRHF